MSLDTDPALHRLSTSLTPEEGATRVLRFGWSIIGIVFGGLVVWSIAAPFEGAVLATGQIAVETNQRAVQHLDGGIVRDIHVRESQDVEAGELLLTLDTTQVDASLESVNVQFENLLGTEARLISERDQTLSLSLRSGYADLGDTESMQTLLRAQTSLRDARRNSQATQSLILRQRTEQLETRIAGMRREIETKDEQIALLVDEISRFEELVKKGNASQVRILALKRDLSRLQGEKEALTSEIAATEVRIGETRSEIVQLDQAYRENVLTELRDVQTQIGQMVQQRMASMDQRRRMDIHAPASGRIIGIRTHTVGGVISPSEPIMFIVPDDDRLIAKVRVSPADVDQVEVGQPALVRFPAFNQDETPQAAGKIVRVSADALTDPQTGQTYFEAVIEIPDRGNEKVYGDLLPGMPVEASLRTGSRSVLSYLVKPLGDSIARTFREG